ncbi:unnamed protein product [Heligmosomoides polygyrus]|uniref:Protein kinase domain-containing protein n=1 Tax=Heligmosomoides polygyrus TaxID=6339 RepID=A0A3P8D2Y2_HELPZ|nr:unnamed protein product [Heligmosomoides polygyrus]
MYAPDDTWNMAKRTQLEEEMQRHTTPMYRAPEILDTYQNFIVGPQQDIWALGCVLFYLCYHVHPFEDSAKLRILNVAYSIPSGFDDFADVLPVIESCLKVDPVTRPVAKDLVEHSEALAIAFDIDLKKPVPNVDTTLLRRAQVQRSVGAASSAVLSRPPPRSSVMPGEMSEQASAMFGAIKGQGLSLLKNLKDRSSAVVQKVQLKLVSQEVTWLTSRVCVVPVTKANFEQCEEQEWNARVAACARSFVVYNLSSRFALQWSLVFVVVQEQLLYFLDWKEVDDQRRMLRMARLVREDVTPHFDGDVVSTHTVRRPRPIYQEHSGATRDPQIYCGYDRQPGSDFARFLWRHHQHYITEVVREGAVDSRADSGEIRIIEHSGPKPSSHPCDTAQRCRDDNQNSIMDSV